MEILPKAEGKFYPSDKKALLKIFKPAKKTNIKSRLLIVPHAGHDFIGKNAVTAYNYLDESIENIIIIAPAIYSRIFGSVSCDAEAFLTPFGKIKIFPANLEINNDIFENENALTVQLPFIKYLFPNATVTPIIYGCEDYNNLQNCIDTEKSATVIVSNLSRLVPERESKKLDEQTSRMIERKIIQDLDVELADGAVGICAAIQYLKDNEKFVNIALTNSAKTNHDTSSVVGYGFWYASIQ